MFDLQVTPITTVEEFEAATHEALEKLSDIMDQDSVNKALQAVETAKQSGLPAESEYSINHIYVTSDEDVNMKLHLVSIPYFVAALNAEDAETALYYVISEIITPIGQAIFGHIILDGSYPTTIKINDEEPSDET